MLHLVSFILWCGTKPLEIKLSGRGAVWLACLTGGQEVGGSNPLAPSVKNLSQ